MAAAEEELGATFPPDLVASLLRHNGALDGVEAFRFSTHDRLLGVSEIVAETRFMRSIAEASASPRPPSSTWTCTTRRRPLPWYAPRFTCPRPNCPRTSRTTPLSRSPRQ
ncbi:hypothetical protein ACWC9U_39725 [Streptomyces sp. 900116325]